MKLGLNRDYQKKNNRGLVLKLIATQQCTSRADLARTTGLTKTAITQIVAELMAKGYLVETRKEETQEVGRNPIRLEIAPEGPLYAGVLIERSFCQAVLCDMQLNILKEETVHEEWMDEESLMACVFSLLDHMLAGETRVIGIGAASVGPVDVVAGRIDHPLFFHDIGNIEIRRILEERYHLPVYFDHDNQSAVLAEYLFGNAREFSDVLLVGITDGVGCGILVGGHRIHSATGFAPEIGHVSVNVGGKPCICGNHGCLETYINTVTVRERLVGLTGLNYTYEEFMKITDHPKVNLVMQEVLLNLENAIVSTLNILNSQIILLSEDSCCWPDEYVEKLERDINQRKFGNRGMLVPVRKAHHMKDAQVLGAACNAINQTFYGELL